ncbi:MAG TPA: DNA ligase D [Burkholderiaceae bacterium]|nr:DNA ligase D [Burkholderiaceae bacterium]
MPNTRTDDLVHYRAKRDFDRTPEPAPKRRAARRRTSSLPSFVVQKHWASRLHYDFRLEWDGVMWSWAVPKGPSYDPKEKRMAVHVEDHPIEYSSFEGSIPPRQYGAGKVIVWDSGTWEPVGDPVAGMAQGKIVFKLHGQKLAGLWELVRISKPGAKQDQWLLFKKRGDGWDRPEAQYNVLSALPDSVLEKPLGPIEEREPRAGDAAAQSGHAEAAKTGRPDLAKARRAALPDFLSPQLAVLASEPPAGEWMAETKFDGYRILARLTKGEVRLYTRNRNDWTAKLPSLAASLRALDLRDSWLDGEIVVLDDRGLPDFNALQNAFERSAEADIVYFVFDAPFLDGKDLRQVPLRDRRLALQQRLEGRWGARVFFSESFDAPPEQMREAACRMGLEGVILKRPDAPYVSARGETWIKLKCSWRQEFVVGGYTLRADAPDQVGSLLLGYHDDHGRLKFAGSVGTGWGAKTGRELLVALRRLEAKRPPFDGEVKRGRWTRRRPGSEHWVKPQLVVEVSFGDWTPDGHVRHASFKGLRIDQPADAVTREQAAAALPSAPRAGVKVTHPDRVVDPSTGLRKVDLVRYYESVADRMLPHLHDRAVSLVRAPSGLQGQLFFQKHTDARMPGLEELDPALWPGHQPLLAVQDVEGLLSAAQMNVIEFHTWNSTVDDIDRPDRVVFDLDPGEGVTWKQVKEAALLTRTLLEELGLGAWLKTSGGKGLHVVVPLERDLDFDAVKDFAQEVVKHMAKVIPERFVAKSGAANRKGRIFIDYLRNGHGQTTVAAFSARARPGLGVSMPISWEQLDEVKSGAQWTVSTAREYLSFERSDPWRDYWTSAYSAAKAWTVLRKA